MSSAAVLALCLIGQVSAADPKWPTFTDVTQTAGIHFKHSLGDSELSNIVEGTGPGGLFFDYDNDGNLDIYFVNGCWHEDVSDNRGRRLQGKLCNALYRNNGDGTFTDVTDKAGVGHKGYGMAASCADYDNDGNLDLYVVNYGPNVLYHNNGDGTFTDVTERSGLGDPMWGVHAVWLDYDRDGDLDVFVVNYLEYDKGEFQRSGAYYKAENYPGPLAYAGQPDHLYRNNGDGTFTDVTKEAGLWDPNGRGMGAVAVDIDRDGDTDIYVTNDAMPNTLWLNDGKGHFTEKGAEQGVAFGEGGQGVSSMGPVVGDVDRNGLLDILVPDMGYGCIMLQKAAGRFLDVTTQSGLALICGQYTGWGGVLVDYDNDGYLDVFIANGDAHHLYTEEAVIARNDGKGRFVDVAKQSGEFFHQKFVGRGATCGDYDNDGDMDILVFNLDDSPRLLRNDGGNSRNWLKVVPKRADTGQIAIGASVTVKANGLEMVAPVIGENGYLSGCDPRPHFGLGNAAKADSVEVIWPDGKKQTMENVPTNQVLEVRYSAR
jgi:hypothetical protein